MAGLETLEIVIGLVFVYLLFSILVTLLVEYASILLKLRANNLRKIVGRVLDDKDSSFSDAFYAHPLIKYLASKNGKKPSYIGSDKFAKAVLDIIRTNGNTAVLGSTSRLDEMSISQAIDQLGLVGDETKQLLKSYAKEAAEDINEFGDRLESWFNETVERGQGWFNRKIKLITLIISLLVAGICNVDSIHIYQQLSSNADLRTQIAENAGNYLRRDSLDHATAGNQAIVGNDTMSVDSALMIAQEKLVSFYANELDNNENLLAIGWGEDRLADFTVDYNWFYSLLGWVITAFAISLGAPFWFGVLNKLVALRAAGRSGEEEGTKRSKGQIKEDNKDVKS